MTTISIPQFSGIVPRLGPTMLANTQAQVADNVKLMSGELRSWRNPVAAYAPNQASVQSIFKMVNGSNYAWLEWQTAVDVVTGPVADPPPGSTTPDVRLYYTGDGIPKKTNWNLATNNGAYTGTSNSVPKPYGWMNMGVAAPTLAPIATAAGGSGLLVDTVYVYTYVSQFGTVLEESAPSPPTIVARYATGATVSLDFTAVVAQHTAYDKIVGIRVYRVLVGANSATYTYIDQIQINPINGQVIPFSAAVSGTVLTGYIYPDSIPDSSLGSAAVLASTYYTPPPAGLTGIVAMPNGMLAGFVGNQLWFCEPYLPHAWPSIYMLTTEYPIVGLGVYNNTLVVGTTQNPYLVTGNVPSQMTQERLPMKQPCVSKASIAFDQFGVVYASPNGMVSIGPGVQDLITTQLFTRDEWQAINPSSMIGFYYNNFYIGFYTVPGTTTVYSSIVLARADQPPLANFDFAAVGVYIDRATASIYAIQLSDNVVYQLDADPVNNTNYTWTSKRFFLPEVTAFAALRVQADYAYMNALTTSTTGYMVAAQAANIVAWNNMTTAQAGQFANTYTLMHFDGANAGTSFIDATGNNTWAILGGSPTTSTVQQRFGTASYLGTGTNPCGIQAHDVTYGAKLESDFTIEMWVYATGTPVGSLFYLTDVASGYGTHYWFFGLNGSGQPVIQTSLAAGNYNYTYSGQPVGSGAWHHLAVVRQSNNIYFYLDGVSITSPLNAAGSIASSLSYVAIGDSHNQVAAPFNAYIDELRFSTVARYTANFTPTGPYASYVPTLAPVDGTLTVQPADGIVADAGTVMMLQMDGPGNYQTITDQIGTNTWYASSGSINTSGSATATTPTKFGSGALTSQIPVHLNQSSTCCVYTPTTTGLPLVGDWTIECWFYVAVAPTEDKGLVYTGPGDGINLFLANGGSLLYVQLYDPAGTVFINNFTGSLPGGSYVGAWHHVAAVAHAGSFSLYYDGVAVTIGGVTSTPMSGDPKMSTAVGWALGISSTYSFGSPFPYEPNQGCIDSSIAIDEFRLSNVARYTANFTPPSAAFTVDANTKSLIHFDDVPVTPQIVDDTGNTTWMMIGGSSIDTASKQYGSGSLLLNSNGGTVNAYDWATTTNAVFPAALNFGTGDFTIEFWVNRTSARSEVVFALLDSSGYSGINVSTSSVVFQAQIWSAVGSLLSNPFGPSSVSSGVWTHIAVVRSGGFMTLYQGGIGGTPTAISGSPATPVRATFCSQGYPTVAAQPYSGHIDALRVSNYARYTANFSPPGQQPWGILVDGSTINGTGSWLKSTNGAAPYTDIGGSQVDLPALANTRFVTLKIYGDDNLVMTASATSNDTIRMPSADAYHAWYVQFTGNVAVRSFSMATTMQELKGV